MKLCAILDFYLVQGTVRVLGYSHKNVRDVVLTGAYIGVYKNNI